MAKVSNPASIGFAIVLLAACAAELNALDQAPRHGSGTMQFPLEAQGPRHGSRTTQFPGENHADETLALLLSADPRHALIMLNKDATPVSFQYYDPGQGRWN